MRREARWLSFALVLAVTALAGRSGARAEEERKMPEVGTKAPDFRLNDQDGKAVRLSEVAKDKWAVLAFFPKASTPG